MKSLKSVAALLLTIIMALGLCACGEKEKPTDVVKEYFTKIQNGDTEVADLLNKASEDSKGSSVDADSLSDDTKDILIDNCKKVTFTVNSEEVNGDSAKVNVAVNSMDLEDIVKKTISNSLSYAFLQSFSGNKDNEENTNEHFNELLNEYLKEAEFTEKTEDVTLTKEKDGWKIDSDDALERLVIGADSSSFQELNK